MTRYGVQFFIVFALNSFVLTAQDGASSQQGEHGEVPGNIRAGVSELNTDERTQTTTGVAEIGYVLRGEIGSVNPQSVALIPFVRSHFESSETNDQANTRTGVGVDLEFAELWNRSRLVLRATADQRNPERDTEADEFIETAVGVFLMREIGDIEEQQEQVQRLRRAHDTPDPISIELADFYLTRTPESEDERRMHHYLVVSFYILKVRERYEARGIEAYDAFLDPEADEHDRRNWLVEHMARKYPLYYFFPREGTGPMAQLATTFEPESGLLSILIMLDDFFVEFEAGNND